MFEPVKAGFGRYMACFYADLIATTRPLEEFVTRGAGKAIMWAPGRMVDAAEEMLSLYARDNIEPGPTKPFSMPIMFVAMAKDYVPSGRDFTRQIGDRVDIALPGDEKGRNFKLRTVAADIRAQVVIAATGFPSHSGRAETSGSARQRAGRQAHFGADAEPGCRAGREGSRHRSHRHRRTQPPVARIS